MEQRNEQLMAEANAIVEAKTEDIISSVDVTEEMKKMVKKIDEQLAVDYLDKPSELIGS
jgi:hypothetical protein